MQAHLVFEVLGQAGRLQSQVEAPDAGDRPDGAPLLPVISMILHPVRFGDLASADSTL